MAKVTIGFSIALILLGVGAYIGTGSRNTTALIPAIAGALLLACGLVALKPVARKHAMHAAVLLAILGFAGAASGPIKLIQRAMHGEQTLTAEQRAAQNVADNQVLLNNGAKIRPVAAAVQTGMAALLLPYIVLCIKSFVDARRARTQPPAG